MSNDLTRRDFIKMTGAAGVALSTGDMIQGAPVGWAGKKPNIVLICSDMVGAMHFGCYGDPAQVTAHIDSLGRRGVIFDRAYCASTPCIPARACMFTGQYSHTHGKTAHVKMPLNPRPVLIPEILSQNGYHTAVLGKTHWWPSASTLGSDEAYLTIDTHLGGELGEKEAYFKFLRERNLLQYYLSNYRKTKLRLSPEKLPPDCLRANWMGDTACSLLEKFSGEQRPFFLYCSFVDPHGAGSVQKSHLEEFKDIPLRPMIGLENQKMLDHEDLTKPKIQRASAKQWRGNYSLDRWRQEIVEYRRGVYASLNLVDANVGKIMRKLDSLNLSHNTYVFFITDHGDLMGDHSLMSKTFLYDPAVRIPCIISGPGIPPGQRRKHFVSQVDLFPTILGFCGIEEKSLTLEGRDIALIIKDPNRPWRENLYCEVDTTVHLHSLCRSSIAKMLRTGPWKYIYTLVDGHIMEEELYHLDDDPEELHNLAYQPTPAHRNRLDQFRSEILRWLVATEPNRLHPAPENHYGYSRIDRRYF